MKKLLLCILLLLGSPMQVHADVSAHGIIKDLTVAYGILMGTIVVHELAHAAFARMLYGVPSDTCIGMSTPIKVPQGEGDMSTISFVGFNAMGECSHRWNESVKRTPAKDLTLYLTGPIIGALANGLAFMVLHANTEKDSYIFSKLVSIAGILGHAAQLIPYKVPVYKTPSDGAYAYEAYKQLLQGK